MVEHTGKTIPVEEADKFLAEIRKIMQEQKLNFGPAVEFYTKMKRDEDGTNS